jgi:pantoate kinase
VNRFIVRINGSEMLQTPVSRYVLQFFSDRTAKKYFAEVDHTVQVPIGSGFGSSGAGALSLALALNKSLEAGFSDLEVAQIAHLAEIECQTGLGTVLAETLGGFEVRLKAGAPGFGETRKINLTGVWKVICLNFSPISKRILKEPFFRKKTNEAGRESMMSFLNDPTPHRFMTVSREFSEKLGLINGQVRKVLDDSDRKDIICSMMMIGNSVFSLVKDEQRDDLIAVFRSNSRSKEDVLVADVDFIGGRLL